MRADAPGQRRFRSSLSGVAEIGEVLARLYGREDAFTLLDVGCGTGEQLLALAERFPAMRGTGIDTAAANIAAAQAALAARPEMADRIRFVRADLRAWRAPPFDVVITNSVLYLIPGPDASIDERLAALTRPGGHLLLCEPVACARNRLLVLLRRLLRALRSRTLEELALRVATRLHPEADPAFLRDRIPYLYVLPERTNGPARARALAGHGLRRIDEIPVPDASIAKLRHTLAVFRRDPDEFPVAAAGGGD